MTGEGGGPLVMAGAVETVPFGVRQKSSTASPSSAPVASRSVQRIQKVAPFGILRLLIVLEMLVRFAAAFPSSAPVVPA